jgi:hypothetical protein
MPPLSGRSNQAKHPRKVVFPHSLERSRIIERLISHFKIVPTNNLNRPDVREKYSF